MAGLALSADVRFLLAPGFGLIVSHSSEAAIIAAIENTRLGPPLLSSNPRLTSPAVAPCSRPAFNKPNRYVLGSDRIATARDPNLSRPTSHESTRFESAANNVGLWPASLGGAAYSYSSINPIRQGQRELHAPHG